MSRITEALITRRRAGGGSLIPFIMAGDPCLDQTPRCIRALARGGADVIELGLPFSDPVADGPTIQRSARRALQAGTSLREVLKMLGTLPVDDLPPLVLMSYYNPIYRYRPERFARDAAASGTAGLIVVDLPPEESGPMADACARYGLDLIMLAAPNTPMERVRRIGRSGGGFLYCVSRMGTTGARESIPPALSSWLGKVRRETDLPLAVGFGISTADHVARIWRVADAAVVGSLLVKEFEKSGRGLSTRLTAALQALRPGKAKVASAPRG